MMNITVRQSHMIACSQSTIHFKSYEYLNIKWSKYWYYFKQRVNLIFGQFHNFTMECTKLTSSGYHVAS